MDCTDYWKEEYLKLQKEFLELKHKYENLVQEKDDLQTDYDMVVGKCVH